MTEILYHFSRNLHTSEGAIQGFRYLASGQCISSILDVGAGVGTWLAAAREHGINDIVGIDGIEADSAERNVENGVIKIFDLSKPISLDRRFDAVLCLEVAEHLDEGAAETLVQTLCTHGDLIFFSAAAPGQHGEHHVNCRWPTYWQALFNAQGFACRDDLRARMWDDPTIEPWYRQNIFTARRDPDLAGREPRLSHLIHPDMTPHMDFPDSPLARRQRDLSRGEFHPRHYVRLLGRSVLRHALGRRSVGTL
jgi:SAM-dependent methyltransferase